VRAVLSERQYVRGLQYGQRALTRDGTTSFISVSDEDAKRTLSETWPDQYWLSKASYWLLGDLPKLLPCLNSVP